MWQDLFVALALVLVLEGVMPFLSPQSFRRYLLTAARAEDRVLRGIGLGAMIAGCVLLWVVR